MLTPGPASARVTTTNADSPSTSLCDATTTRPEQLARNVRAAAMASGSAGPPAGHGHRQCKAPAVGVALASAKRSMLARLGFVASVLTENISTSRTCRLKNATPPRIGELIRENLDALGQVVDFLERRRILLYRITSNLVPFASHPVNRLRWWDEFGRLHRARPPLPLARHPRLDASGAVHRTQLAESPDRQGGRRRTRIPRASARRVRN